MSLAGLKRFLKITAVIATINGIDEAMRACELRRYREWERSWERKWKRPNTVSYHEDASEFAYSAIEGFGRGVSTVAMNASYVVFVPFALIIYNYHYFDHSVRMMQKRPAHPNT